MSASAINQGTHEQPLNGCYGKKRTDEELRLRSAGPCGGAETVGGRGNVEDGGEGVKGGTLRGRGPLRS